MVKTPPFHVFHPPSRSLAPRIWHQSLPVSTSSVASAKEEPSHPVANHLLPKLKPLLPAHFRVIAVAIAIVVSVAIETFVIDVVDNVAEMGNFSIIDQLFGVGHQIAFGIS